jgi:hypothetical protein
MLATPARFADFAIIWAGRNNYVAPETVKADVAAMVAALGHQNYLVLSVLNGDFGGYESAGGDGYRFITGLNRDLANTYGPRFLDVRSALIAAFNPAMPQDLVDRTRDVVPSSLRADSIHLAPAGYNFVATTVAAALAKNGFAPLVNISTRIFLQAGQQINPGFVVGGAVPRRVLIRAVGPGLAALGVPNTLQAPTLAVFSGQTKLAENAGWNAELAPTFRSVGAFGLPPGSKDCALLLTLNPGAYTAFVAGGTGDVILELYLAD